MPSQREEAGTTGEQPRARAAAAARLRKVRRIRRAVARPPSLGQTTPGVCTQQHHLLTVLSEGANAPRTKLPQHSFRLITRFPWLSAQRSVRTQLAARISCVGAPQATATFALPTQVGPLGRPTRTRWVHARRHHLHPPHHRHPRLRPHRWVNRRRTASLVGRMLVQYASKRVLRR
jgi:hypothetical protein